MDWYIYIVQSKIIYICMYKKKKLPQFKMRSDTNGLAKTLIIIKTICDKHELFFWLNYGALLGMIREGKLLYWNNDIEVCCWAEKDTAQKIIKITDTLLSMGYTCFYYKSVGTLNIKNGDLIDININIVWKYKSYVIRPHETASEFKNSPKKIMASLFYWLARFIFIYPIKFQKKSPHISSRNQKTSLKRRIKDFVKRKYALIFSYFPHKVRLYCFNKLLILSEFFGGKFILSAIPISYFENFKTINFYEFYMNVPEKPEKLLKFIYGDDWKIPKEEWSFYDEKNKSHSKMIYIDRKFDYNQIDLF